MTILIILLTIAAIALGIRLGIWRGQLKGAGMRLDAGLDSQGRTKAQLNAEYQKNLQRVRDLKAQRKP